MMLNTIITWLAQVVEIHFFGVASSRSGAPVPSCIFIGITYKI